MKLELLMYIFQEGSYKLTVHFVNDLQIPNKCIHEEKIKITLEFLKQSLLTLLYVLKQSKLLHLIFNA